MALVIVNFYRDIDKTIAGYAHMASSVEAAVVHEMVQRNERQLMVLESSLDKQAISRGESAFNPTWTIAHQINQVDHFLFFIISNLIGSILIHTGILRVITDHQSDLGMQLSQWRDHYRFGLVPTKNISLAILY
ncbi:hypothetical protein G7083_09010 [Vibrio sp. HDW18]|uniref:hypothetical protein n=1 Tax=Vibrio sp. HDW18 TaxID=2714948 RepID=UPI00140752F7|nr:hypothetical protein [Vibrio sp. HDW18]QIL85976.1 hypothetical protein G7083_09010 [Vibrio sp. HDW18]